MRLSDEETKDVEQEAQAAVPATETEEVQSSSNKTEAKAEGSRDTQAYNWAEANKKMKELDRQNREMAEKLNAIEKQKAPPVNEYEELDKLSDDDILTKAQARKLAGKMAKEAAQEALKQRDASTVDDRLAQRLPDFADVVTKENIELLKQNEPELAMSLYHIPDPFQQGVAAYKMLKKLGIGEEVVKSIEKEKAQKNASKPVSVNAVTKQSAIGNAHLFENGLTPELKSQLWKEMQQAAKQA